MTILNAIHMYFSAVFFSSIYDCIRPVHVVFVFGFALVIVRPWLHFKEIKKKKEPVSTQLKERKEKHNISMFIVFENGDGDSRSCNKDLH